MNKTAAVGIPLLVLAAIIAGVAFAIHRSDAERQACADRVPPSRILAFGDSLVAGNGASITGGFVTILSREAGVSIANFGKSGDTTVDAKARLTSVVAAAPTITLVLLGGNDALQRLPVAETEKNLAAIIEELQKNGSQVVLLGVVGGLPDPYAAMYRRLAKEYGVDYVPNVLAGIIGHSDLMSDSVHPNQQGYQKIADKVLPTLERACKR